MRQPLAVMVGDCDCREQLRGDNAAGRGDAAVRRRAGNDQIGNGEGEAGVDQQPEGVQRDEAAGQEPEESVHILDRKAGPTLRRRATGQQQADDHCGTQTTSEPLKTR
jgi:hypothetical protein